MNLQVFFNLKNLQVSLSCINDKIVATASDSGKVKQVNLLLLNFSKQSFQSLLQQRSSQVTRYFDYLTSKELLVFNAGLKGGGCGSSKTKKQGLSSVSEANFTQITSAQKLNRFDQAEYSDIKYPSLSGDFELTYLDEEAHPLQPDDNTEKQLNHANSDRLLANYYMQVGRRAEAKQKLIQSYSILEHFLKKGDEGLTEILNQIAQISFELEGNMQECLDYYTKALQNCYENIEVNQKFIYEVCFGLSKVYAKLGEIDNFNEFFQFIEKDLKSLNVEKELEFYFWVGENFMKTDFFTSNKFLMKSLTLLEKVPNFNKKKELLMNLGSLNLDIKSWEESKNFYLKALKFLESIENPEIIDFFKIYQNLCIVYDNLGDRSNFKQANESLLKYQSLISEADESLAKSLFNLGLMQVKEGEVLNAIDSFKKSVEIRLNIGKKPKDCQVAYKNIASALYNLKRFKEAKEYFIILLEIHRSLKNTSDVPECLCNIGACCIETDDYLKGYEVYQELLSNEQWNIERKDVEGDFFSFAWILNKLDKFEESARMYEKAVEIESRKENINFEFLTKCFNNAESSYSKVQRYEQALKCALENLKIMKTHFKNDRVKINTLKNNIKFYRRD